MKSYFVTNPRRSWTLRWGAPLLAVSASFVAGQTILPKDAKPCKATAAGTKGTILIRCADLGTAELKKLKKAVDILNAIMSQHDPQTASMLDDILVLLSPLPSEPLSPNPEVIDGRLAPALVQSLKPYSGQKLNITADWGDADALGFARDVQLITKAAGWDVTFESAPLSVDGGRCSGVEMTINNDANRPRGADVLANGLIILGYPIRGRLNPSMSKGAIKMTICKASIPSRRR